MTDAATTSTTTAPARQGRSDRPAADPSSPFFRGGGRHRFTAREATVIAVSRPVDEYVRVTLSGPDFDDFVSTGPTDHCRVFFPDPVTGALVAPRATGPGEDGIVRPDAPTFARDFTPLNPRVDAQTGQRSIDVDILLHVDPGPRSRVGGGGGSRRPARARRPTRFEGCAAERAPRRPRRGRDRPARREPLARRGAGVHPRRRDRRHRG